MSESKKFQSPMIAGVALALAVFVPAGLHAQDFVYTNNNLLGANSVSAFSIGSGGTLTPVAGSPFATGGGGTGAGFFASNRITASVSGNFLYASNCGTNNVSGFSINATTGALAAIPGSPFATGGSCGAGGISVSTTPNSQFLYAANAGSSNISAFGIASNGALSPVAGSPFAAGGTPDGIKVSPDGRYLAVALQGVNQVAVFSIGLTGALTAVPGSPFAVGGSGNAAGVDINCASNLLFAAEASGGPTIVSVQSIDSNGALSPIAGSPFTFGGIDSNVIVLSPDDLHAFVSNQFSNTITALDVASGGSLTQVAGSPFANPGGLVVSGMATNQAGTFLYAANAFGVVTGFSIAGNGALTPVPGSPFATGAGIGLLSLAVFPPKSCLVSAPVDIKPGSCPNPLNTSERGVIPVAVAGTSNLNVTQIDPASVELAGVPALRSSFEDVTTPFTPFTGKTNCNTDCTTAGPDGILDMVLQFDAQEVVAALGPVTDGECMVVQLTGSLLPAFGGAAIKGEDVVIIRKKK